MHAVANSHNFQTSELLIRMNAETWAYVIPTCDWHSPPQIQTHKYSSVFQPAMNTIGYTDDYM